MIRQFQVEARLRTAQAAFDCAAAKRKSVEGQLLTRLERIITLLFANSATIDVCY
jgi:hypothetical protein